MPRDDHEHLTDWQPVRQVFNEIVRELAAISESVTEFIRETVPVYLVVPISDHRVGVESQLLTRLTALSQRRPLSEGELAASSDLAARRAAQGIPIDALIAAHQAADQEIWRLTIERGAPRIDGLVPEIGQMIFAATSAATEVMARSHSRVSRDIDGGRITLAHQFLKLLDEPADFAEATLVGTRLGFDPHGEFTGLVWIPPVGHPDGPLGPASGLRSESIDLVVRAIGEGRLEMIAQTADTDALLAQVMDRLAGGRVGVGLTRLGLHGAVTSLGDARIALSATTSGRTAVLFSNHWPEATCLTERDRIEPLTRQLIDAARTHPHIAETVMAFAICDMSIAATAQHVHLHANSVTYRLDRWASLTGVNPRTFDGLVRSVLGCRLADQST